MSRKIYKRVGKKKTSYYFFVDTGTDSVTGERKLKCVTASTYDEARRLQREMETQVDEGTFVDNKTTVGQFLAHWLETYGLPNLAPSTYTGYKMIIEKHLIPAFDRTLLRKLTPVQVQSYYTQVMTGGRIDGKKKLGRALSPTTVLQHHHVLHKALESAVKWQMVSRNVCDAVDPPRKARNEMTVLNEEQAKKLLDSLKETYAYIPTFIAITCGMRLGEILGLRWQDVDLKESTIKIQQTLEKVENGKPVFGNPKTAKSRRQIEVAPLVIAELKAHRKIQAEQRLKAGEVWQDWDLVCSLQDGRPMVLSTVSGYVTRKAERLGITMRFHDLRHTAASFLLKAGVNPKVVAEILGHSTTVLTLDTYSHLLPGIQREATSKLTNLLFNGH